VQAAGLPCEATFVSCSGCVCCPRAGCAVTLMRMQTSAPASRFCLHVVFTILPFSRQAREC
jgi:hypothetical protein